MALPCDETKVLIIGPAARNIGRVVDTLNMVRASVLFADTAAESLRILASEVPDLIICQPDLPDRPVRELLGTIRADARLSRLPILVAGEHATGVQSVFEVLNAGADEVMVEHFDPSHFLAKLVWLIDQRQAEDARRKQYLELRRRQMQTLEIMKEASHIFRSISVENNCRNYRQSHAVDPRLDVGLGMVTGLAELLQEQIEAVGNWFDPRTDLAG